MNSSCIILTHYFVRDHELNKLGMIEFCVKHFRKNNPDAYIILVGHGVKPDVDECDYIYWPSDIVESDLGQGHPALSNIGIDHAIDMGFSHALKCASYGILLLENILSYCHNALEKKRLLITQETQLNVPIIGDLFMYGDLKFMKKCYNLDSWYQPEKTGLISLARNFIVAADCDDIWHTCLMKHTSFRDIYDFKWIDLRVHWHRDLINRKRELLSNSLPNFEDYLWGAANGKKLRFSHDGDLIQRGNKDWVIKKEWDNY